MLVTNLNILIVFIILLTLTLIIFIVVDSCKNESFNNFEIPTDTIIIPLCGLGNRLFTISKNLNNKIYWSKTASCNCEWDDIFEPVKTLKWVNKINSESKTLYGPTFPSKWWSQSIKNLGFKDYKQYQGQSDKQIEYYAACSNKQKMNLEFFKKLKPSPAVYEKLKNIFKDRTGNNKLLGIHIRYTDNKKVTKKNSIEDTINSAVKEINNYPTYDIFLASDNNVIKNKLIDYIYKNNKNKVFYQELNDISYEPDKQLSDRKSTEGMIRSIVDLFGLSTSDLKWSNGGKTFSHLDKQDNVLGEVLKHITPGSGMGATFFKTSVFINYKMP